MNQRKAGFDTKKTDEEWLDAHRKLIQLCRSVDCLLSLAVGKSKKVNPWRPPERVHLPNHPEWGDYVGSSTYRLA